MDAMYDEESDTPPPLPATWEEGMGVTEQMHSALLGTWAVTGRSCICTNEQKSKRKASGGGCLCLPKLSDVQGHDTDYPAGAPATSSADVLKQISCSVALLQTYRCAVPACPGAKEARACLR